MPPDARDGLSACSTRGRCRWPRTTVRASRWSKRVACTTWTRTSNGWSGYDSADVRSTPSGSRLLVARASDRGEVPGPSPGSAPTRAASRWPSISTRRSGRFVRARCLPASGAGGALALTARGQPVARGPVRPCLRAILGRSLVITIEGLSKLYARDVFALDDITLSVGRGEFAFLPARAAPARPRCSASCSGRNSRPAAASSWTGAI